MEAVSCSSTANRDKELESVTWTCLPSVRVLGANYCLDYFFREVSSLSDIYNLFLQVEFDFIGGLPSAGTCSNIQRTLCAHGEHQDAPVSIDTPAHLLSRETDGSRSGPSRIIMKK